MMETEIPISPTVSSPAIRAPSAMDRSVPSRDLSAISKKLHQKPNSTQRALLEQNEILMKENTRKENKIQSFVKELQNYHSIHQNDQVC
jgi:hypothetical protein